MNLRRAAIVLSTIAALSCHKPAPPSADASAPSTEQILATTLPGVVLLVNRHDDGAIGFGAGVVLDDDGLVLTNLHVVAGGALGALKASTKGLALALREEPAKQGERVMAVGHPSETVWSFTTGVVSSLRQGMIQTDAAINPGNSGGPLIDASGKVVGINTSKLVGDVHGIGFARPIDLAKGIIAGHATTSPVNRSTPELAVKTCARGYELAAEAALDCVDEDAWWDWMQEKLRRKVIALKLKGPAKADFERRVSSISKEKAIEVRRATQLALMRGEDASAPGRAADAQLAAMDAVDGAAASYKKTFARVSSAAKLRERMARREGASDRDPYDVERNERIFRRTGMRLEAGNPRSQIELSKMGIRIEKTKEVDPTHAWVAVTGRNLDATEYRVSYLLVKKNGGWQRVARPIPADEKTLPADFPRSMSDYEADLDLTVAEEAKNFDPSYFKK